MTAVLTLSDVHFSYPASGRPLLRGLSLRLEEGEGLGLRGSNGCGKSTLLHGITGLVPFDRGNVLFDGAVLSGEASFRAARPRMGYLLQRTEDMLFCPTVLEDAAFGPLNLGLSPKAAEQRAREVLEELGVAHLAPRAGCDLSGGERKLAALAAVLAMRPRLLLLDEPTNDLDPESLERLVEVLRGQSLPFIAVSHDENFLRRVCGRLLRLEYGLLREESP